MKDSLVLLSSFIENPKQVGAIVPSSRFLTKEIISNIDFKKAKNIVELGPGLGTFTKEILKKSNSDAKLYSFEINRKFYKYLSKNIDNDRLILINASAEKISEHLQKHNLDEADYIVSGLPFHNFSKIKKKRILNEIKILLNENGKFILFQYTNGMGRFLETHFSKVERKFVALNIPPCFVYVCEK